MVTVFTPLTLNEKLRNSEAKSMGKIMVVEMPENRGSRTSNMQSHNTAVTTYPLFSD